MSRSTIVRIVAPLAMTVLFSGAALAADQTFLASAVCRGAEPMMQFNLHGGLANLNSSTTLFGDGVVCGIGQDEPAADTNDDVKVYVWDGNLDEPPDAVWCFAIRVDEDWGSIAAGEPRYACSTAGGCVEPPTSYTGETWIRLADVTHGGAYATSVVCFLPAGDGFDSSGIKSIVLDQQP